MNFQNILVTTDFSEASMAAFEIAAYQAKMSGSKVTLLNVVGDWDVPETLLRQIPNPESVSAYRNELLQNSRKEIEDLATKHFHGQDVISDVIISTDPIAQEICGYAKKHSVDLIIMSGHGRGSLGDFFLGSVVQRTIKLAECPVLVVPKPKS